MSMKEKLSGFLSNISNKKENKEDYEFLKEYHESNLIFIQEFLQDSKILSNHPIVKAINDELERRKKITEDFVNKLKEKYLNQYIRYNFKDGLNSYSVFKILDIKKINKDYYEICYHVIVSNVDGEYSINNYKNGSIKLYSNLEETKIEIITQEEYKKEFNKALKYYISLEKDDNSY